jgi:lysophospholipase L1-like esterase
MRRFVALSIALGSIVPLACASSLDDQPSPTATAQLTAAIRYVALGDSYTIGTSVGENDRWPNQLAAALADRVHLDLVANLGVDGFTSADVISLELPRLPDLRPDFVTLLIGVNDAVRGVPTDIYNSHVEQMLASILSVVPADRVAIVSVPDYTRTPRGEAFADPFQQRQAIREVNAAMEGAATARGIAFVDIGSVADQADKDPSLIAGDGLHPSRAQYARWVELIAPVVAGLLSQEVTPT